MIDAEEVLAVCAHEFPEVTKRVYKEPEFLKERGTWIRNEYTTMWDIEYHRDALVEPKETADKIMEISTTDVFYRAHVGPDAKKKIKDPWQYAYSFKNTSGNKKYRCVGGPKDGQYGIIGTKDYVSYNCAENNRWKSDKEKAYPTGMLIHKSLLKK
jgi:hypothetical protein